MWGFYIPIMLCVGVIVYSLLRHYAAPGVPLFVRIVVSVAWTTSLSIVALVPIDVWNTLQHKSGGTGGPIGVMWSISYWTSQAMTWILVPWTMGFVDDGNFTWFRRLFGSIRGNMVFHASVGSIVIIGVILLLATGQLTFSALPQLALTLSNTYGLVAGVFLLGFGLVEIPRALWNASDPEGRLQYLQYRVGRTADTLEDAAFELQSVITVVEATHQPMSRRDPLRPLMDKIYEYAERHSPFSPSMCTKDSSGRINLDDLKDGDLDYGCDEVGLASLRQRLRRAVHNFEGDKASYVNAVQAACNLEVIVKCRQSGDYTQRAVPASAQQSHSKEIMIYKCIVHPWVLKLCSLVLAGISFMVVWSEATIGSGRSPDLSPFSQESSMSAMQAIHAAKHGEVATQLLVMAPLVYMCMCCHYALMRLGVLKFGWLMRMGIGFVYHMVPHCTHSQSLLRNGGWVCRFIAPICYNFLHVIRMHLYLSAGETTVFSKKMGKALSDVPIFGQGFNSWFPIVVVVWCGMLFLNVWGGVARVCLPSRYRFSEGGSSEHHERGRLLLRKEQDCLLRGRPISEALDLWGTCEAPGTPGARARIAAGSKGKPTAGATSRLGMAPEAAEDSKTAKRWSRSNLSAATQAALGGAVEPPSLSGSSQAPPAAKGPQLKLSLMQHKHGSNDSLGGMARPSPPGHSGGSRAVGGLDDIFARMSPSTSGTGTGRIDDDEDDSRDGNLLGSAEDSLAGTHVSWQARRGGK